MILGGHKFKYDVFHEAIERQHGPLDFLAIEVDAVNGKEIIRFVLPEQLESRKSAILETIRHTDETCYFVSMNCLILCSGI